MKPFKAFSDFKYIKSYSQCPVSPMCLLFSVPLYQTSDSRVSIKTQDGCFLHLNNADILLQGVGAGREVEAVWGLERR